MSPTDAILMRIVDLSGGGGGGGSTALAGSGSGGGGAGDGAGSGTVAQAASNASTTETNSGRALVTDPNAEDVDLRNTQAAAQKVQFVEVLDGPDIYTVIIPVVNLDALDV